MNLLANQLSLASIELRSKNNQSSLIRLRDTQQVYRGNSIVQNNIGIAEYLNESPKDNKQVSSSIIQQQIIPQSVIKSFEQSIAMNPINYIPYYNLFSIYGRQNNLVSAYPHLIEAISALKLQNALSFKQQKIVNYIQKQYCSQSVLVYMIKAIIHVKNQKYIIAISNLLWIVEKVDQIQFKVDILQLIKIVYHVLGQKDKQLSTDQQINQLKNKLIQEPDKHTNEQSLRLKSTCQIPSSQQELKTQLSKRLKQFASLIKEKQPNTFKSSNTINQVLFKQVNSTYLLKNPLNKSTLLRLLNSAIHQSPLFTESQSKALSRSRQSSYLSINQSQEFGSGHVSFSSPKQDSTNSPDKKLSRTTRTPNKVEKEALRTFFDESASKKLNISLNSSGLNSSGLNSSGVRGKKKTQNIYPLQKQNLQVEIKLVMAQLTNNKQLLGNMDPYCIITYNNQKKQSTIIKGGGLEPRWKESFVFSLTDKPSAVTIEIFVKEGFFKNDDFVGSGTLVIDKNGFTKIQVFQAKKQAGTVFVSIQAKV